MEDSVSILISAHGLSDRVIAFIPMEEDTMRARLRELQTTLSRLLQVLQHLLIVSKAHGVHDRVEVAVLISLLHDTMQSLHDAVELLLLAYGYKKHSNHVEGLMPSIQMMSAAANQIRFKSLLRGSLAGSAYPAIQVYSLKVNRVGAITTSSIEQERSPLEVVVADDSLSIHAQQGCIMSEIPRESSQQRYGGLMQITGPRNTDEIGRNDARLAVAPLVRAVSNIAAHLSHRKRKRNITGSLRVRNFDTPKEYLDCAAWLLEQVRSHTCLAPAQKHSRRNIRSHMNEQDRSAPEGPSATTQAETLLQDLLPRHPAQKYFAIRAACCILASFRPLTTQEVFAAATIQVQPNDIHWPFDQKDPERTTPELLSICRKFLRVDAGGLVHFRDDCSEHFFGANGLIPEVDAHIFMTLVCLTQMKRQPRLLLKPWLDFHQHESLEADFPLHLYVVTFWQRHFLAAEFLSEKAPDELVIQAARIAEFAAESLVNTCHAIEELDGLLSCGESLDIELEISIARGFEDLKISDGNGIAEHGKGGILLREQLHGTAAREDETWVQTEHTSVRTESNSSHQISREEHNSAREGQSVTRTMPCINNIEADMIDKASDFSDWVVVEKLDPAG